MPALPPPITSRTNVRAKALRAAFAGKAGRPGELVGIEGWKSILEASQAGLQFDTIAVAESDAGAMQEGIALLDAREFLVLRDDLLAAVTDTVSPPQIAATVAIPSENRPGPRSRVYLLLEEIQDPGNMGTLIRSAEAFGVERVYLSPGCANPWGPKAIRASAGSVFRQALVKGPLERAFQLLHLQGVRLLGAVARGEGARTMSECTLAPPLAIVIGNEGSGLSADTLSRVHEKLYIPCFTESLNAAVAGSVLLYDVFSRNLDQLTREQLRKESQDRVSQS